jgi:S1-C subfamily serine protease
MNNLKSILKTTALMLVVAAVVVAGGNVASKVSSPTKTVATDAELAETTAMITNLKGNSGGTGVIVKSTSNESEVLTNAHVCEVVKNGGMVTTDLKRAVVTSYRVSQIHDLCLITVKSDLHVNTKIATSPPETYSSAAVSGHPALLPTIVTRGHFGDHEVITIMTGMRQCTEEDANSELGILCMILGGIPIVKNFEAQIVSSTIMPGSSGSAVFNSNGEIAGMVFAGSNILSYGHIVPQEYVQYFIEKEVQGLKVQTPDMKVDIKSLLSPRAKLIEVCNSGKNNENYEKVASYCKYVQMDLIYE